MNSYMKPKAINEEMLREVVKKEVIREKKALKEIKISVSYFECKREFLHLSLDNKSKKEHENVAFT